MTAIPTQVPTWATDTNFTGGPENGTATKVEPSSGRKAEGFEPAVKPTAQETNWLLNLIGQWCDYVNACATRSFVIPAGDFKAISGTPTYSEANGTWTGVGTLLAALRLASGEELVSVRWMHNRGNAGTMTLRTYDLDVNGSSLTAHTQTNVFQITTGNGFAVQDIAAATFISNGVDVTMDDNDSLSIGIDHNNAANIFHGLQVTVKRSNSSTP